MVLSEQSEDGSTKVEGLCRAPCQGAFSPGETVELDSVLADYDDAGCFYYACFCFGDMPPTCTEGQCVGKVN